MDNSLKYTEAQKVKIKERVSKALDQSFEVNQYGTGCPLWMNILFILENFNKGKYYGTLELKILGTTVNDIREKEKTHKMRELFEDVK